MIFAWIEERKGQWPIVQMCRVLEVSRSGFYAWHVRDPSAAAARREQLTADVKPIHADVKARYGSPRMRAELVARGHACSVNFVARVMRETGIAAKTKRRFRQTTDSNHTMTVAPNVLARRFDPDQPNASWVADITYVPTREGWLYLAAVVDLFSRRVVGWSMDGTMTSRLVVGALEMALAARLQGASPSSLVAHSDRGTPSASAHYRRRLADERITGSMSRRGDCWDNAPTESFFASLKKERVHDEDYATRAQARASIFEYIEAFYNRVRGTRHWGTLPQMSTSERIINPAARTCPLFVGNSSVMPDSEPFAGEENALRTLAMGFPGATEEFPWGHRAIKVKGKIFVTVVTTGDALTVTMKLPDSGTYALTQPYAKPTGYGLGRHGWVTCTFPSGAAVPMDLLEEWVEESYRAVAPKKLVLARNAQLGGAGPSLMQPAPPPASKPRKKQ